MPFKALVKSFNKSEMVRERSQLWKKQILVIKGKEKLEDTSEQIQPSLNIKYFQF